jgi:hypothetical protein
MLQTASWLLPELPLFLMTAVATHLVMSFAQTLMHYKLGHHPMGGKFFRNHINFHHTYYSKDHLLSRRYLGDEGNNTPFFFIPVFLVGACTYLLLPIDLFVVQVVAFVPAATLVGFLVNPKNPIADSDTRDLQAATTTTRQQLLVLKASNESELDNAFAALVQGRAGTLLVQSDPFFNSRPNQIIELAAHHATPAMYQWRDFPRAGGLMSYGAVLADAYRLVGVYAGRILKGAKTTELPVQQSVKIELVINLRTAKTLGLEVPPTLLTRADEVIE